MEGVGFPVLVEATENRIDDPIHAWTLLNTIMGRVRGRTSTKQRWMTLVVRSFRHKCGGNTRSAAATADRDLWEAGRVIYGRVRPACRQGGALGENLRRCTLSKPQPLSICTIENP